MPVVSQEPRHEVISAPASLEPWVQLAASAKQVKPGSEAASVPGFLEPVPGCLEPTPWVQLPV